MNCPYCKKQALWCDNKIIYGRNYGQSHKIYYCKDCNAYVGCHNNSRKPLGYMANKELRDKRVETHKAIDYYWRYGFFTRDEVYKKLKEHFGKEIHIGNCNYNMCSKIIEASHKLFKTNQ